MESNEQNPKSGGGYTGKYPPGRRRREGEAEEMKIINNANSKNLFIYLFYQEVRVHYRDLDHINLITLFLKLKNETMMK